MRLEREQGSSALGGPSSFRTSWCGCSTERTPRAVPREAREALSSPEGVPGGLGPLAAPAVPPQLSVQLAATQLEAACGGGVSFAEARPVASTPRM